MLGLEYRNKLKEYADTPQMPVEFSEIENSQWFTMEYRIWNSLIRVGLYALAHEKDFLSDVIDYFGVQNEKGNLSSYYTRRLDPKDLFHCLKVLDADCLWIVLETIKGLNIMDLEKMRDAILLNDTETYKSIITNKDVDTSTTTPICRLLYVSIRLDELYKWWENLEEQIDKSTEEEEDESEILANFILEWISRNQEIENDLTNIFKESYVDPGYEIAGRIVLSDGLEENSFLSERETIICYYKKLYPTFVEDGFSIDDYYSNRYRFILGSYCQMKKDFPSLSTIAKVVMEGILKDEGFQSIWSRFDVFDGKTIGVLLEEMNAFNLKHGMPLASRADRERELHPSLLTEEPKEKPAKTINDQSESDSQPQDFRDATSEEQAKELYDVIVELLNKIEGREDEFLSDDYVLNDLKNVFRDILIMGAGENEGTQKAIIEELAATEKKDISDLYYHKKRLWLQPFFIIIGHLYNKGMLKGGQKNFVKALFPEKQDYDPVYRVVNKEDFDFLDSCRAKISLGNTKPPKEWKKWFEWIDTLL